MARDYAKRPKKKSRKQAKNKSSNNSWTWMFTGLLIGLLVAGIGYLKLADDAKLEQPAPVAMVKPDVEQKPGKPQFDFYTLLPEMEVAVPEPQPSKPRLATKQPTPPGPNADPIEQARYRLQLASFRKFEEADSLKAKLALEGHFVEIQSVKLATGQTWYRVRTPVVGNRDEAINLQRELQKQAINSMILKASEEG